jgi:pentatricopeptide repeat protein
MKLIVRRIHQSTKLNFNVSTTTQLHPNTPSHASLLQACTNIRTLEEGRRLHAQMLITGIEQNDYSGSKLVGMYAKSGSLEDARLVFEKIARRNVVSWNVMIRGYVDHGHLKEALRIYDQMQTAGMLPDDLTFPFVLKACAGLGALQQGKDIHNTIMRLGFESNVFVGTTLIDMYVKCRTVDVARQVFDKMSERNVVSWTAMIVGYVQNGLAEEALELFRQMQLESIEPCVVTIAGVLPACAQLMALRQGKEIHNAILKLGFEMDDFVLCSLIDMYAKCGNLEDACRVFDKMSQRNVVLWTAIIAGCAQNGNANEALRHFKQMRGVGLKPNPLTVSSVLPACAHLETLQDGQAYGVRTSTV